MIGTRSAEARRSRTSAATLVDRRGWHESVTRGDGLPDRGRWSDRGFVRARVANRMARDEPAGVRPSCLPSACRPPRSCSRSSHSDGGVRSSRRDYPAAVVAMLKKSWPSLLAVLVLSSVLALIAWRRSRGFGLSRARAGGLGGVRAALRCSRLRRLSALSPLAEPGAVSDLPRAECPRSCHLRGVWNPLPRPFAQGNRDLRLKRWLRTLPCDRGGAVLDPLNSTGIPRGRKSWSWPS